MVEPKISLSLYVPGAILLSSQECDKNPKESYDEHKMLMEYTKGKGKYQKKVKKLVTIKTRKPRLITQNISMCKEAYEHMLSTAPSRQLEKNWKSLSEHEKLKCHFDLIAHDFRAVDYSYEVFGD